MPAAIPVRPALHPPCPPLDLERAFAALPPPCAENLRPRIRAAMAARSGHKLVVLDDDPTGTQTVCDVPVLTAWDVETLRREFALAGDCFYILTNSRSLAPAEAEKRIREIARNLAVASPGRRPTIVSRSDSTLRGHFPLETDVLAEELGPFDATLLIPYFQAGGRFTLDDIHYVAEDRQLIPAAQTPFARDAAFGYRSSNLREWVEEKTAGRVKAESVASFPVSELRRPPADPGGEDELRARLRGLPPGAVAVVNACHPADLIRFAAATREAEQAGGRYLFRTAAEFVAAYLGLEPRPLWQPPGRAPSSAGGLTVIGSYVPKSTGQLEHLLRPRPTDGSDPLTLAPLELAVNELLSARRDALLDATAARLDGIISAGGDAVVFTSRHLVTGSDPAGSLAIGNRVSAALVELIHRLRVAPRYLVAKGGITSSDLATQGLGVKRAIVRGQISPGVPVWELGPEARFPAMPYIVFPGNVGGPAALTDVLQRLAAGRATLPSP